MVGPLIILVWRTINPDLIIDLWIMPLRPKTSEMAKEQERKVEPPGKLHLRLSMTTTIRSKYHHLINII